MVLKINGCGGNPPEMLSHQQPRVHVFIYTFNKAAQLAETLKSLAATNYLNYKLIVLDNGSTDETQDILLSFDNGMFNGLKVISLPINIGAPAARNWLVHDEETRQAEYVVFFDDDIIVQPDWLIRMLDTFKNCPDAGVVGAKIINAEGKKVVQHSGGLLTQAEDWINRVVLFSNVPDDGRFDTIGQRDYLMGCANMYRRDVFDRVGDFDLQFSPTQFDDVDHHLRMRLHGLQVIFNGQIEIRHLRSSGGPTNANHVANRYKLSEKFNREQIEKIVTAGALRDFVAKHPWINQQLAGNDQPSA